MREIKVNNMIEIKAEKLKRNEIHCKFRALNTLSDYLKQQAGQRVGISNSFYSPLIELIIFANNHLYSRISQSHFSQPQKMLINLNLNGLFWSDCVSTAFGLSRWGDDDDDVHVTQPPELRDIESLVTVSQCSEQNKLMDSIIWNIFENWQIGSCEIYLSCKINYWSLIVMLDQARVWTYSENIEPKFSTMKCAFLTLSTSWSWMSDESWLSSSQICTR